MHGKPLTPSPDGVAAVRRAHAAVCERDTAAVSLVDGGLQEARRQGGPAKSRPGKRRRLAP